MSSPDGYRKLAASSEFKEMLAWMEKQFETPHLNAEAPTKVLPNYGELYASRAAQFRVVREMKRFLDKKSK